VNTLTREAASSVELGWVLGLLTVVFFLAFIYWFWYAYAPSHRARMTEASLMPFDGGEE